MEESNGKLSVTELAKTNRLLEQTIKSHKQAFESINDDFIKYQTETDQVVRHLETKVRAYKARQKELVEQLNAAKQELQSARQESQLLRSQNSQVQHSVVQQSKAFEQTCRQYEQERSQIVKSDYGQTRAASELQYVKMALNTLQTEFNAQKADLKRAQDEVAFLEQQLSEIKSREKPNEVFDLEREVQRLSSLVFRQQIIISALGAPFDPASSEVANALLEASMDPTAPRYIAQTPLEKMIQQTVTKGLYLLGMRQNPEHPKAQEARPWRAARFEGAPEDLEYPMTIGGKTTFLLQSHETFQGLITKCQQLDQANALQKQEITELRDSMALAEQKTRLLEKENAQLQRSQAESLQLSKTATKHLEDELAYWKAAGSTNNAALADQRIRFSQRLQELSTPLKHIQQSFSQVTQLAEFLQQSSPIQAPDSLRTQLQALEALRDQTEIRPTVLDLGAALEQSAHVPFPPNVLRFLDEKLEKISVGSQASSKETDRLAVLFIQILMKQNPRQTPELQAFLQKFHQLVQQTDIEFDPASPGASDEGIAKAAREMQRQLSEKSQLIEQLQAKLSRATEMQKIELKITQQGDLQIQPARDVAEIFRQAQSQNRSGRYLSFLEILLTLVMEYVSKHSQAIHSIVKELTTIKDTQLAQLATIQRYSVDFKQAMDNTLQKLVQIQAAYQQSMQLSKTLQQLDATVPQISATTMQLPQTLQLIEETSRQLRTQTDISKPPSTPPEPGEDVQIQTIFGNLKQQFAQIKQATQEEREMHQRDIQKILQDKDRIKASLSQALAATEKRLTKAEADAAGIRKVYTQLSVTFDQEKQSLLDQIQALNQQKEKLKDIHRQNERSSREELTRAFREKERFFDQQIRLLAKDTIVESLAAK